jgi:methyltransferase (TIGR00027 family)
VREDRPSSTAGLIAWATAAQARLPELAPLVPAGAAEACGWFIEALRPGSLRALERSSLARLRLQLALFDRFSIRGICLHYLVRKRFLEQAVRAALGAQPAASRRVLVLGAGFDTLCLRLHREFPDVEFVECDHPATQTVKLRALAGKAEIAPNLRFVAADFTQVALEQALGGLPGFERRDATTMVAEGLTMYLTQPEIEGLFAFVAAHGGPGSRCAFTFLEPRPDGKLDFRRRSPLVGWWLRLQGEPFRWGIERGALPSLLAPLGFAALEIAGEPELRERVLRPLGLAERDLAAGEALCVAERRSR